MTLTIQDLGALGELLGSIAVLFTLVYLALQTRQNTMAISAQLDAATMIARQEGLMLLSTSKELAEALNQQRIHPQPIEQDRVNFFWIAQMVRWQWQFQHSRRGLMLFTNMAAIRQLIGQQFDAYRDYRDWWERTSSNFNPEFVEWVEEQRSKAA